jgi:hypothetical protein
MPSGMFNENGYFRYLSDSELEHLMFDLTWIWVLLLCSF